MFSLIPQKDNKDPQGNSTALTHQIPLSTKLFNINEVFFLFGSSNLHIRHLAKLADKPVAIDFALFPYSDYFTFAGGSFSLHSNCSFHLPSTHNHHIFIFTFLFLFTMSHLISMAHYSINFLVKWYEN
jgi:hypothetical protein